MKKKRILYVLVGIIFIGCLLSIWTVDLSKASKEQMNIEITLSSDVLDEYQLFYSAEQKVTKESFDINYSYTAKLGKTETEDWFSFPIPLDTKFIRFDMGNITERVQVKSVILTFGEERYEVDLSRTSLMDNDMSNVEYQDNSGLVLETEGSDPYVVWDVSENNIGESVRVKEETKTLAKRILMTIVVCGIAGFAFVLRRKLFEELRGIYRSRRMIFDLSRNDFKNKFSGSYLGVFWAFVQPIVVVTIYWFVFSVGFKSLPVNDCPYLLWLISGICPWFFFNDALNAGSTSLYDYSYIVKKIAFKVSILPIVKIISCAFVHVFFIVLVAIVFGLHGVFPSVYALQVFYYSFCTFMLSLGITYLISAMAVFFKDLAQIVSILLQFGMWMTPIMYSETTFGVEVQKIFKLNPMYYVVNGYREALISRAGFWEHPGLTIYFWAITLVIFGAGILVFKKLRPHFADVL